MEMLGRCAQGRRQTGGEAVNKRNPSGKSPAELSTIFYRELLQANQKELPSALFDASVSIQAIVHLPHMAGEDVGDVLQDMIDDGEVFEDLLGKEITSASELVDYEGFIVKAHAQIWNFSQTIFGKNGVMDSCHNDCGSYVCYGFGQTLADAYKAVINQIVARQAKQIEIGLKAK